MGRFFVLLGLAALLAFAPFHSAGEEAQPVFFSLLFPQLMPQREELPKWIGGLGEGAFEAVML